MNHRLHCVNAIAPSSRPCLDTPWDSYQRVINKANELAGKMPDFLGHLPVWFFWLYKEETDADEAWDGLTAVRRLLLAAVEDAVSGRPLQYPQPSKLRCIPKKVPGFGGKIRKRSRSYSFAIGYF